MEPEYIKPSEYARRMSLEYATVIRKYHRGEIPGVQDSSGTIRLKNHFHEQQSAGKTGQVRDVLLVEHKDRLTRFGWGYTKTLLAKTNQRVESVNTTDDKNKEIVDDLISIITSFCGKIYGANRKAKTMRIIHDLEDSKNED